MEKVTFCEIVLEQLPYITTGEQKAIRAELEAHLADHAAMLEEKGVPPEEARAQAEEAMGDPEEIGKALAKQYPQFWLWVRRGIQVMLGVLVIFALCFTATISTLWPPLTAPLDMLSCAWENWQVRQGDAWELGFGDSPWAGNVIYSWPCWEVMQVGDNLICLTRVDLVPLTWHTDSYLGYFHFCTYNEDLFTTANREILKCLTLTPESGISGDMVCPEHDWGWSWTFGRCDGVQGRVYTGMVMEGDSYVDVTYDCFGTLATMRCPMAWKLWKGEEVVEP